MTASDANFDGVLAGTLGGIAAGQLSTDTEESDYEYLVTLGVAAATAVDALVGANIGPPPPIAAQANLLDEISFGFWMGRNPSSGTSGDSSASIDTALGESGLMNGIVNAYEEALVNLGSGGTGTTSTFRNNAFAGALGGMLAQASQVPQSVNSDNQGDYAYITSQAYAFAVTIDMAIPAVGGTPTVLSNLVCELAFAWSDGRNPSGQDGGFDNYSPMAEAIATVYALGAAAIASPPDGAPTSAAVWDAALCGGLGGMLAGQLSTDDTTGDWSSYIAAAVAFAYAIDVVFAAVSADTEGGLPTTTAAQDMLRQICHAWMRNRNPPQSVAAHSVISNGYLDIAGGIVAYFAEAAPYLL